MKFPFYLLNPYIFHYALFQANVYPTLEKVYILNISAVGHYVFAVKICWRYTVFYTFTSFRCEPVLLDFAMTILQSSERNNSRRIGLLWNNIYSHWLLLKIHSCGNAEKQKQKLLKTVVTLPDGYHSKMLSWNQCVIEEILLTLLDLAIFFRFHINLLI